MLTNKQVESLKLGITPIDDKTTRIVGSAIEWIKRNTDFEFDLNNEDDVKALPDSVGLFIIKFFDVNKKRAGVSSQSIEGLSQSFDTKDINDQIWQFAEELFGDHLKGRVTFIAASNKWQ